MKKKLTALLLACLLTAPGLVSCASDQTETPAAESPSSDPSVSDGSETEPETEEYKLILDTLVEYFENLPAEEI